MVLGSKKYRLFSSSSVAYQPTAALLPSKKSTFIMNRSIERKESIESRQPILIAPDDERDNWNENSVLVVPTVGKAIQAEPRITNVKNFSANNNEKYHHGCHTRRPIAQQPNRKESKSSGKHARKISDNQSNVITDLTFQNSMKRVPAIISVKFISDVSSEVSFDDDASVSLPIKTRKKVAKNQDSDNIYVDDECCDMDWPSDEESNKANRCTGGNIPTIFSIGSVGNPFTCDFALPWRPCGDGRSRKPRRHMVAERNDTETLGYSRHDADGLIAYYEDARDTIPSS